MSLSSPVFELDTEPHTRACVVCRWPLEDDYDATCSADCAETVAAREEYGRTLRETLDCMRWRSP